MKVTIGMSSMTLLNNRDEESTEGREPFVDYDEGETKEKYRTDQTDRLKDKKLFDATKESEKEYWKIFNRANPEHAKPQLAEEPVPLEPVKPKNNT